MGTIVNKFLLYYLLLYPQYCFAFDHVTIVNEDTIDKEYDSTMYKENLFQPTSYLNAGYGMLFEHIGTVYQSVHTHYLIVGVKIPTHKDIPDLPLNGTKPCVIDADKFRLYEYRMKARRQCKFFNDLTIQVNKQAKHWYTRIFHHLHSDIPALLPNQEIKFLSEVEHPVNDKPLSRRKRDTLPLSKAEKHRVNSYKTKYSTELPNEMDTMYTVENKYTHSRPKRFIGTLIKGLASITKGGNIFGRLVSGVRKIGGFIFKGLHGLFHHHKVTALHRAVNTFKQYASKLKIGELFKFKAYRDLHISKVSLYDKLNKALHHFGPYMNHKTFLQYLHNKDNRTWYYDQYEDLRTYWQQGLEVYYFNQAKSLSDLMDFSYKVDSFTEGLDILSTGKLSQTLIHPRRLLKLLRKVVRDVTSKNSQFVPLYTELYHYYETHSVSFTNTDEFLIMQIPIFFINKKQLPLDLYRLHTVHVPLDKDTYDGKEHKYTKVDLSHSHLAISDQEYMDLTQHELDSCIKLHMDYLCPNLRLTASTKVLSCAAALFQVNPQDEVVRELCSFTYYEHIQPPPKILETQDEILLANLPSKWQLVCDNQIDRPIPLDSAIYTVVNRDDLCTCGIIAQHVFLYESMRMCDNPDTQVTLYYTYNRALTAYDYTLNIEVTKRLYTSVPEYRAPDIFYAKQGSPAEIPSPNAKARNKRDTDSTVPTDNLIDFSIPLDQAVNYMESGDTYYLPSSDDENNVCASHDTPVTQDVDFYFNIVTVVNFLTSLTNALILSCCYRRREHYFTGLVTSILQQIKGATTLKLTADDPVATTEDFPPSTPDTSLYFPLNAPWIVFLVFISMLIFMASYWIIMFLIVPLTRKSSICRYLFPFTRSNSNYLTPATDIFLDIVHIKSGEQIRVFLTTLTAPPCSLSFTGSVKITNFTLSRNNLVTTLHIDWHNCVLHYNDHIISLPNKGKAFSFQPNLLTDFSRPGPYNIQLLARHMDALLQIPHASEMDYVTASDLLLFPYTNPRRPSCPYQQLHDEVLQMMPLADTPSASPPPLIPSTENEEFV